VGKIEVIVEPHGSLQFGNLEHAKHRRVATPSDQTKPIKGCQRSQGTVKPLTSAAAIRAIVDNEERFSFAKNLDCALGPCKGAGSTAFNVKKPRLPRTVKLNGVNLLRKSLGRC
jgi:hypothetical protein